LRYEVNERGSTDIQIRIPLIFISFSGNHDVSNLDFRMTPEQFID